MASYQERAHERLCRWVQTECRALAEDDSAEDVSDTLAKAMAALRQRPTLFRYCVEEVSRTRHNALFRRFIGALTRGGPGGVPRPIEAHASDPKRYVGDMLGWLHQAAAGEKELVAALLRECETSKEVWRAGVSVLSALGSSHGGGDGGSDGAEPKNTTRRAPEDAELLRVAALDAAAGARGARVSRTDLVEGCVWFTVRTGRETSPREGS